MGLLGLQKISMRVLSVKAALSFSGVSKYSSWRGEGSEADLVRAGNIAQAIAFKCQGRVGRGSSDGPGDTAKKSTTRALMGVCTNTLATSPRVVLVASCPLCPSPPRPSHNVFYACHCASLTSTSVSTITGTPPASRTICPRRKKMGKAEKSCVTDSPNLKLQK